jgi:hypothetical protein
MALFGDRKEAYRVLVLISEGKRPRGTSRFRWEYNTRIKVILQVVGLGGMDWIDLLRIGHAAGACEWGNETSVSIKCGEFLH